MRHEYRTDGHRFYDEVDHVVHIQPAHEVEDRLTAGWLLRELLALAVVLATVPAIVIGLWIVSRADMAPAFQSFKSGLGF